jgi:hypothetical protein
VARISPNNIPHQFSGRDIVLVDPPLHTLPREKLIAKLKTLTNLRAVRDEKSSTGWKVEVGPFPGWAEVPEW